jgi:rubrerythrin
MIITKQIYNGKIFRHTCDVCKLDWDDKSDNPNDVCPNCLSIKQSLEARDRSENK